MALRRLLQRKQKSQGQREPRTPDLSTERSAQASHPGSNIQDGATVQDSSTAPSSMHPDMTTVSGQSSQHGGGPQLAEAVRHLAQQVIAAGTTQQKEQAVLKLYAVLSQAQFVQHRASEWEAAFQGLLQVGLARFIRHASGVVVRHDKGYSKMVQAMAAAILKILTRWMEQQLDSGAPAHAEVLSSLREIVMDTVASESILESRQRDVIPEDQSILGSIVAEAEGRRSRGAPAAAGGSTSILDTHALEGILDSDASRQGPHGADSSGLTVMDTGSLEALVRHPHQRGRGVMSPMLDSTFTGSTLDTQDVAQHIKRHRGAMRAAFWLIKADQPDGWYAAVSLIGSIAFLGEAAVEAMGAHKVVKPVFWVLRSGRADCQFAAVRALEYLTLDISCQATLSRHESCLKVLSRLLHRGTTETQFASTRVINNLVSHSPSTHYVFAQAGIIPGLVGILSNPHAPASTLAAGTEAIKHLTAVSQRNRSTLVANGGLNCLIQCLATRAEEDIIYNSARAVRHLALGSEPAHKAAGLRALVPLTLALQDGRPRVQFACASALSMLIEGHPEVCQDVARLGCIDSLVLILSSPAGQGRKAAAEALQALAAEGSELKGPIMEAGAIPPLIAMAQSRSLQQQAAAAGALQALAYVPGSTHIAAAIAMQGGTVALAEMLGHAPLPLQCAAAGALCNLGFGNADNQAAMVDCNVVPGFIRLMRTAQPDGQYAAAAALCNLCPAGKDVRLAMMACNVTAPIIRMLQMDSWYCRIVAAELLARLATDVDHKQVITAAGAVPLLEQLLFLETAVSSDSTSTMHLAYERGQDVIVMKGYKFSRAKLAAAAALGCLAAGAADWPQLREVLASLLQLLRSRNAEARAVAAAVVCDVAVAIRDLDSAVWLEAAASINTVATETVVEAMTVLLRRGDRQEQHAAAHVLDRLLPPSAPGVASEGDLAGEVRKLCGAYGPSRGVSSTCVTRWMASPSTGFAITAKPSASLYVLLQIPQDAAQSPSRGAPAGGGEA